jgi:hypothetical protein
LIAVDVYLLLKNIKAGPVDEGHSMKTQTAAAD